VWVDILKQFQIPGAPVMLRLMHWGFLQHLATHFQVAREIFFAAEGFAMLIQAALFALIAFALLYFLPPRRARTTLPSSVE
jgi:hypothetical protein